MSTGSFKFRFVFVADTGAIGAKLIPWYLSNVVFAPAGFVSITCQSIGFFEFRINTRTRRYRVYIGIPDAVVVGLCSRKYMTSAHSLANCVPPGWIRFASVLPVSTVP